MTPFGQRLRALRAEHGRSLAETAAALGVSSAYLSALEHGHRGRPSPELIHRACQHFNIIWDEAEELARLARLSHPRVTVDTAGLSPEATLLANRLAERIADLQPARLAALLELLESPDIPSGGRSQG
ncbi:Transcriptional regulator, contains XRE-family HTH domain [Tistlia consotensis]|uniref:Transcriptional regulator, contains XRE-family HTH domain n=1 Tax=Tistlia consotensis USBA 355 TaxID=560819 RepID=A0A1Y6BLL0_9PROT|nr:helix-turn-helix domain-containing protein [Tistlia consotensis]SMF08869.1 Transcriptional regulator, contains XRE-family HTH domain [Tistlia consotensis USBA 355]SNR35069.1 Transcriptional regulator, contains XRE-family HTH domain [Tistlia consotensis]